MVAQQSNLEVGDFIWTGGDVHLCLNHQEQAKLQLTRKPYALATLKIKSRPESIFDYKYEDFCCADYQAYEHIKAPISV
jgi:thymidylate synthase